MEDLVKQIRFYFSPSNLSNDNILFLKLHYEKQIHFEFLLKFNKISSFLKPFDNPKATLIEACSSIPEIIVSDPYIRPTHDFSPEFIQEYKKKAEARSLYFENLPDDATIETIQNLFNRYGQVLYTSLPRFQETGLLKGFGFIELDSTEACEEALQDLSRSAPTGFPESFKIMKKKTWLGFKEKLQKLKLILRTDSPDREFFVLASGLPEKITKTQIMNFLQIKPWKIEYKQSSGKAKLVYTNRNDVEAVIRCQPNMLGKQVYYSYIKH